MFQNKNKFFSDQNSNYILNNHLIDKIYYIQLLYKYLSYLFEQNVLKKQINLFTLFK